MKIDWRWRRLFNILQTGLLDEQQAKIDTARILRASLRTPRMEREREHG